MYQDQPQPSGPPLPAEPHEPGPTPRRCRLAQGSPCDCSLFCWRAAEQYPIEVR